MTDVNLQESFGLEDDSSKLAEVMQIAGGLGYVCRGDSGWRTARRSSRCEQWIRIRDRFQSACIHVSLLRWDD